MGAVGLALLVSCSPGDRAVKRPLDRQTTGTVTLVDSLQLIVDDSAALGTFSYITSDPAGGVLVSDVGRGRLLRYGSDGRLRQVVGRYGGGPGEFKATSVARTLKDGRVLAVIDPKRQYLSFLDPDSGQLLGGLPVPFVETGQTWTETGTTVVFGVQAASFLIGKLNLEDNTFTPLGQTPDRLLENLFVVLSYGRVEALPHGTGYLAMLPTVPGLQLFGAGGEPHGTVDVPATLRRGNPTDLIEQQSRVSGPMRLVGSVDGALTRFRNGDIGILYMDFTFADASPPTPTDIRYYITVLSKDLQHACVDLPVPHNSATTGPLPVFADGDLLITSEHIEADSVRTVIYRYRVTTDGCDWLDTGGVQASPPANTSPHNASRR